MSIRKFLIVFLVLMAPIALWAQNVVRIEYFLDSDPGYGQGRTISNIHVGENQLSFDVSNAEPGPHVLSVRAQNSDGHWSQTISRPLFIDRLQDIAFVEYFIDNDPGIGNGTPVALPSVGYKSHLDFNIEVSTVGLAVGQHMFYVRACDVFGQWTDLMNRPFTIYKNGGGDEPVSSGDLSRLEYFFDTDPGYGCGFPLSSPNTGTNTYTMSFESTPPGVHVLSLRAQDDAGHWSQTLSRTIYILEPCGGITYVEYFFDDDPGEGKGITAQLPENLSAPFAFEVSVDNLTIGTHQFCVRAKSSKDQWSVIRRAIVEVSEATGVDGIVTGKKAIVIYDLQGRSVGTSLNDNVEKDNLKSGVYIKNGKKVVIK